MTDRFRFYRRSARSSIAGITAAAAWVRETASRHRVSDDIAFKLDLCANELLDNILEHAYKGRDGEIGLELFLDGDAATLTVIDDAVGFDPTARTPSTARPSTLLDTKIGGLGLNLVHEFADSIAYERAGGCNRVAIRIGCRALVPRGTERRRMRSEDAAQAALTLDATTATDRRCTPERRNARTLNESALFHGVPQDIVDGIIGRCELRTCKAHEVVLAAGEHHRCVLLAVEGRLEVHLDGPGSSMYVDLGPGECVGELSVADGKPISAWVVAGTDCKVLAIPEPVFVDRVLAVPTIARNLVVILSERMRRSNLQIVARTRAAVELEALQRELAVAREIQANMLPAAPLFPLHAGIKGRGYMRAAQQVGGDFYDAFLLSDGRAFLAIGDVCNKGTPAALFMVRTLTILRSEASAVEPDPERHLARLAARCNDLLTQSNEAQQFVTVFCAIVDPQSRTMHYVLMGHCPPVMRAPDSAATLISTPRNPLAGLVPGLSYSVGRASLPTGSLVVLYTDGVTEAESASGALFDEPSLLDAIDALPDADVDACVERIVAAVDIFSAGHPQSDDITLLAFTLG